MTIIAMHLRCDSRKVCSQCSIYLWKPSKEKTFYFYCPSCKHDILCDRGLKTDYEYDEFAQAKQAIRRCLICGTAVEDKEWPAEIKGVKLEMSE